MRQGRGNCPSADGRAAPRQPIRQEPSRRRQSTGQRPLRDAQPPGHGLSRLPFQFAEHDRHSIFVRQPIEFTVEHGEQLGAGLARFGRAVRQFGHRPLLFASSQHAGSRLQGSAKRHAVEPVPQQVAVRDRSPPHQDQKRCLERIVGIGGIPEDAAAHAQDHRPMPPHQRFERGIVAAG